ncbi:uncharacterized protein ASCRUDRAFT_71436 [Ascoidea rubescens DSM 1968]|uniref:Outer spore wall protein 5 n=1 Tax=Ascoidea rubescens DSM 1968 TaxID=1344418 RepID=A0A1D2VEA5_9ASCO|nr:hypothetical protein ASCRUDRAFT_71436 [Ascoidea rubescens DSM 1968]ODV59966.1 hypothetical protein ASCRUDRAFT_71436 [Ascoidea rubescens DSM 1968]
METTASEKQPKHEQTSVFTTELHPADTRESESDFEGPEQHRQQSEELSFDDFKRYLFFKLQAGYDRGKVNVYSVALSSTGRTLTLPRYAISLLKRFKVKYIDRAILFAFNHPIVVTFIVVTLFVTSPVLIPLSIMFFISAFVSFVVFVGAFAFWFGTAFVLLPLILTLTGLTITSYLFVSSIYNFYISNYDPKSFQRSFLRRLANKFPPSIGTIEVDPKKTPKEKNKSKIVNTTSNVPASVSNKNSNNDFQNTAQFPAEIDTNSTPQKNLSIDQLIQSQSQVQPQSQPPVNPQLQSSISSLSPAQQTEKLLSPTY